MNKVHGDLEFSGNWVKHSDYEVLRQELTNILKSAGIEADTVQAGVKELVSRMTQLVTENAALKYVLIAVRDHWFKSSGGAQYEWQIESQTLQEAINQELETPATDAYLNAVRADVIVEAASRIAAQAWEEDEGPGIVAAVDALEIIEREFRAGNAGKDGSHEQ